MAAVVSKKKEKNSTQIVRRKNGNSNQSSSYKTWCFTLNNYKIDDLDFLCQYFSEVSAMYVIGKEIGKEKETPHLQGYVAFLKRKRLTALKKIDPRAHWEICRNVEASIEYCMKDGDYRTNIRKVKKYKWPKWYDWQQDIIDEADEKVDSDRTINWYWEESGNVGKSTLVKYLIATRNATIISGKASDSLHSVGKRLEAGQDVSLVVVDVPRSMKGYVSYQAIEKIKDGCFFTGKYEGGQYIFDSPHVFVFSNQEPDTDMMSEDRWNIIEIKKK